LGNLPLEEEEQVRVGVLGNPVKSQIKDAIEKLKRLLEPEELVFSGELAPFLDKSDKRLPQEKLSDEVDYLLSFGGDGTFLRAARFSKGKPLAGINLGGLGFLTIFQLEELDKLIGALRKGEFELEERMALRASLSKTKRVFFALNDVTITITGSSRMIHVSIEAGGEVLSRYKADGVIIATPTGSTAYNLAAGGPILYPRMEAVLITPICAHTLSIRSVILPPEFVIHVVPTSKGERILFSADGQDEMVIRQEARVEVVALRKAVKVIRLDDSPRFFTILQKKLGWG
jgi:NAD+ kinase